MERQIPGPLWIAIISLGMMVFGKVIAAMIVSPLILIDAVLSGILLFGLIKGQRWAYVLTFIGVVIGTILGLSQSVQSGLIVLMLDCLVLVPVLLCTDYFFPKDIVES